MLSGGSNSNTPIPSVQQQRDARLIICMPCNDSERETESTSELKAARASSAAWKTMFWGWGRKVEDKDGRSGWKMTSSNTHSVQDNGKTQRGFTMPARFTSRTGLGLDRDRNINSKTAAGLECLKKSRKSDGVFNAANGELNGHYSRHT